MATGSWVISPRLSLRCAVRVRTGDGTLQFVREKNRRALKSSMSLRVRKKVWQTLSDSYVFTVTRLGNDVFGK